MITLQVSWLYGNIACIITFKIKFLFPCLKKCMDCLYLEYGLSLRQCSTAYNFSKAAGQRSKSFVEALLTESVIRQQYRALLDPDFEGSGRLAIAI